MDYDVMTLAWKFYFGFFRSTKLKRKYDKSWILSKELMVFIIEVGKNNTS